MQKKGHLGCCCVDTRPKNTSVQAPKAEHHLCAAVCLSGSGILLDKSGSEPGWYDASEQLEGAPSASLAELQGPAQVLPVYARSHHIPLTRVCMQH